MTTAIADLVRKKPDLKNVELPYTFERCLLMTAGRWNGVDFPASAIAEQAKKLAADKESIVRLYEGATTDHQDSTGTMIGHSENHEWDGETLWGDCVFIVEKAARIAKYQKETKLQLEGISPRMSTTPDWKPANARVDNINEFKSFGIVLDPAQGEQAMLSRDTDGRALLKDGPVVLAEKEEDTNNKTKTKEVSNLEKLFCEKCELLFDEGTEKCSKCEGTLKKADEATVTKLEKKAADAKAAVEKEEQDKKDAKAAEQKQKDDAEALAKKAAKEKADALAAKEKEFEYPEATHKGRPYMQGTLGYKSPYYGKADGKFHKEASTIRTHTFSRKPALDQVADMEELTQDFVGFCGAVLKSHKEGKLELADAVMEISAMLKEIPLTAELSKEEVPMEPAFLELVQENEELKKKDKDAELKAIIDDGHKIAPARREDLEALLSVPADATLSAEGEAVDVAGCTRRLIASLPIGATLSIDEKTKRLIGKEAKLSQGEETSKEKRKSGADSVPKHLRKNETK